MHTSLLSQRQRKGRYMCTAVAPGAASCASGHVQVGACGFAVVAAWEEGALGAGAWRVGAGAWPATAMQAPCRSCPLTNLHRQRGTAWSFLARAWHGTLPLAAHNGCCCRHRSAHVCVHKHGPPGWSAGPSCVLQRKVARGIHSLTPTAKHTMQQAGAWRGTWPKGLPIPPACLPACPHLGLPVSMCASRLAGYQSAHDPTYRCSWPGA